jgi:hypothetical protein
MLRWHKHGLALGFDLLELRSELRLQLFVLLLQKQQLLSLKLFTALLLLKLSAKFRSKELQNLRITSGTHIRGGEGLLTRGLPMPLFVCQPLPARSVAFPRV